MYLDFYRMSSGIIAAPYSLAFPKPGAGFLCHCIGRVKKRVENERDFTIANALARGQQGSRRYFKPVTGQELI